MSAPYEISNLARQDLDSIWDFIFRNTRSVDVADNFIDYVFTLLQLVADSPNIGVSKDHLIQGLRRFPFPSHRYYIYYTPLSDGVYIERVLSAYRNQESLNFE